MTPRVGLLNLLCLLALAAGGRAAGPQTSGDGKPVTLVFAGDIMLDTMPGEAIARGDDPFAAVKEILADADVRVGNLECVIGISGQRFEKPYNFRAHPRVLPVLARHFDAMSLANNHTGDFGDVALLEMIQRLDDAKIGRFGAGRNLAEARQPWIVQRRGVRIALLGYNEFQPREFAAGDDDPGVAWAIDEQVMEDIHQARDRHQAHVVIPFMHWGWEEELEPNDRQRSLARAMIDAGATAVVGAHPHVTQGHETYRDKLIVYSLGNCVFDGFEDGPATTGWLLRMRVNQKGLLNWETLTIKLDAKGLPHPASE